VNNYNPKKQRFEADPEWRADLEKQLNEAQLEFVTTTESALLGLAGPGSGKTRALIFRAAHLIKSGTDPENLLLLTFTNKAAEEMKERLKDLLGYWPHGLWAGTFHSMGARILRRHAALAGRSANFTILDEDDSTALIKQIIRDTSIGDDDKKLLMKRNFLGRVISQARNSGLSVKDVMQEDYSYRLEYLQVVEDVAEKYEIRKLGGNNFDFDDLLLCWLKLFNEQPDLADFYRSRFSHLLVDEFQDTNVVQSGIIDLFAGHSSICVVGDDAQSIYAFRYANIDNILTFPEKYANCCIVRMEQNYRSTPEIVELANCSISYNRDQLPKQLFSKNDPGEQPSVVKLQDAGAEADFLIQAIRRMRNEGVLLKEMAVLYRSSYLTPEIEFALGREGISYRTYGGVKFFQKAHIKDVLAYLKVIYNPFDEQAWRRIAVLQQGLGPGTFTKLWEKLKSHPSPLDAAIDGREQPKRGKESWKELIDTLTELLGVGGGSVPLMIETILKMNYDQVLKKEYPDQYDDRLHGIERLAIYSDRFNTLDTFLESLALEESVFAGVAAGGSSVDGQLTLSTIHSAKGKEWDAVFIIGMNQGHFPSSRSIGNEVAEERRLFYVAVTRARRYLFLTTYRDDFRSYGATSEGPSLFLRELPPECYRLIDYEYGY